MMFEQRVCCIKVVLPEKEMPALSVVIQRRKVMTHNYRGSIIVLSLSKSVEPNEEQKEMISGFQQGILCKYWNKW